MMNTEPTDTDTRAAMILERCDVLGAISEEPDCLTRRYGTPAMRAVNERVMDWMRAVGMNAHRDAIGNLIARYEADAPDAPTLLLGSHLDTVRDAGKYDGPLGVLVALALVETLHASGVRLPFALELYGFCDEEGLRYHTGYLGSRAVAGDLNLNDLNALDADGIALIEAIRTFGGDPDALATCARRHDDLLGYCEVHIEQGPVLEARNLPVGVVSAIQGQSRVTVSFTGIAGHAGTVPMAMRHDALCAASEFLLEVERLGRATDGLVATVGQLDAYPGASNVIPGQVTLSLDVRHQDDTMREQACERLESRGREIAQSRGVAMEWHLLGAHRSVPCAPHLRALLAQAIADQNIESYSLPSGAGHDAVPMSLLTDVTMLFVRCAGGISHSPAESVVRDDVAIALATLQRFVALMAEEQTAKRGMP